MIPDLIELQIHDSIALADLERARQLYHDGVFVCAFEALDISRCEDVALLAWASSAVHSLLGILSGTPVSARTKKSILDETAKYKRWLKHYWRHEAVRLIKEQQQHVVEMRDWVRTKKPADLVLFNELNEKSDWIVARNWKDEQKFILAKTILTGTPVFSRASAIKSSYLKFNARFERNQIERARSLPDDFPIEHPTSFPILREGALDCLNLGGFSKEILGKKIERNLYQQGRGWSRWSKMTRTFLT